MVPVVGIIQVRGIGDAIIAMPIAQYYKQKGHGVYFALDDRYCESFQYAFPDITFVPVSSKLYKVEEGINCHYWFETPFTLLQERGCDAIISFPYHELHLMLSPNTSEEAKNSLVHRLQNHAERRAMNAKFYQHFKFDEFKYHLANVPFEQKWNLKIRRNYQREQELFNRLVRGQRPLIVTHLAGSDIRYAPESLGLDTVNNEVINITDDITTNIFDWLTILEKANTIITLDSVFCNLIEQLNFKNNKQFIRRSGIHMTPVLKNNWDMVVVDNISYGWYY